MPTRSATVQETIRHGLKTIALPSKIILISTTASGILLLIFCLWWGLLLFPAGVILSTCYSAWATQRWRLRAYEHVEDIHQLQRSAELAGLLMVQSHERAGFFMGKRKRRELKTLLRRFSEENAFVDDLSIPNETSISRTTSSLIPGHAALTLNDTGLRMQTEEFFKWDQICDERIIHTSYNRMSPRTGRHFTAGEGTFFRFECEGQRFEMPLSSLHISEWELDFLLYIYRGRFALKT